MRAERPNEMMKLGAFFQPTGNHIAAWLHPAGGGRRRHNQAKRPVIIITFYSDGVPKGPVTA
jgi:hypothetical protein